MDFILDLVFGVLSDAISGFLLAILSIPVTLLTEWLTNLFTGSQA